MPVLDSPVESSAEPSVVYSTRWSRCRGSLSLPRPGGGTNVEESCGGGAQDRARVDLGDAGDARDEVDGMLFAHVERIVRAEHDPVGAEVLDETMQHAWLEDHRVEVEVASEVAARGSRDGLPAFGPHAVGMIH